MSVCVLGESVVVFGLKMGWVGGGVLSGTRKGEGEA